VRRCACIEASLLVDLIEGETSASSYSVGGYRFPARVALFWRSPRTAYQEESRERLGRRLLVDGFDREDLFDGRSRRDLGIGCRDRGRPVELDPVMMRRCGA